MFGKKPFELRTNGEFVAKFKTYAEAVRAMEAVPRGKGVTSVDERVGSRLFNKAMQWSGDTPLATLAGYGLPLNQKALADDTERRSRATS